ncbi:MAG: DMT family transporter [Hyphomicrobiaceae bacterium]
MTRATANLVLLLTALIWGLAFVFQKTAMESIGPLLFVATRSAIAALALAPLAWLEHRRNPALAAPGGFVRIAALGGAMFFLGAALQQVGLVTATVTNTGFLTGLYVVVTPLLAWMIFRRVPASHIWVAVALAFVGTWLLGGGTLAGFSQGDVLVAVSALFWAGHMLVVERGTRHARPVAFTTIQFIVVAAIAGGAALALEPVSIDQIIAAGPELLYVGVLSSALTFTLLAVAMRHTPASEAAILVSMETVFAALCAALLLGERLSAVGWVGAALMFAATLVIHAVPYVRRPPVAAAQKPDPAKP